MLISTGDWVVFTKKRDKLHGAIGYVVDVYDHGVCVCFTSDAKGNPMLRHFTLSSKALCRIDENGMTEQDFATLMDIALSMRDYEWCKEIQRKYEEGKACAM